MILVATGGTVKYAEERIKVIHCQIDSSRVGKKKLKETEQEKVKYMVVSKIQFTLTVSDYNRKTLCIAFKISKHKLKLLVGVIYYSSGSLIRMFANSKKFSPLCVTISSYIPSVVSRTSSLVTNSNKEISCNVNL